MKSSSDISNSSHDQSLGNVHERLKANFQDTIIMAGEGPQAKLLGEFLAYHLPVTVVYLHEDAANLLQVAPSLPDAAKGSVKTVIVNLLNQNSLDSALKKIRVEHSTIKSVIYSTPINKTGEDAQYVQADLIDCVKKLTNLDVSTSDDLLNHFIIFSQQYPIAGGSKETHLNTIAVDFVDCRQQLVEKNTRHGTSLSLASIVNCLSENVGDATEIKSPVFEKATHHSRVVHATLFSLESECRHHSFTIDEVGIVEVGRDGLKAEKNEIESLSNTSENVAVLAEELYATAIRILEYEDDPGLTITTPFSEFGFDSISFTKLAEHITSVYQIELTPPILFELSDFKDLAYTLFAKYPNILIERDASKVLGELSDTMPPTTKCSDNQEPIAIVGMSCRFPGAPNISEFWKNLAACTDSVGSMPAERVNWQSGRGIAKVDSMKWGGVISNIDQFDPLFFGISPREAEWMDPQQRILMQAVWHALEDAGETVESIKGSRTGVFVGVSTNDYAVLVGDANVPIEAHMPTGLSHAVVPNRLSYYFDLHGPSEAIDTACSSSLVAVHRAVTALRGGECDLAIVAGVNALLSTELFDAFQKAGMLSPTGKCHSFDQSADGYVRGEGVGVVILKPISAAVRNSNRIRSLLRNTGVNHGGRVSSLTVPSARHQAELIVNTCTQTGVDFKSIGYIEAHGSGTPLGDPIELSGLIKAAESLGGARRCFVGSVKANIGHLEAAAGIAGLIKTVLALQEKKIPGNPQLTDTNKYISLEDSYIELASTTQNWDQNLTSSGHHFPRRAGVSSFGFGGSNAFAVLEEYELSDAYESSNSAQLILLSGRTPLALLQRVRDLHSWLGDDEVQANELDSISFSLSVHRTHFEERLAFVVCSTKDLKECLSVSLSRDFKPCELISSGNSTNAKDIDEVFAKINGSSNVTRLEQLNFLRASYESGASIDWRKLFTENPPRLIDLPGYPFERERYWFAEIDGDIQNKSNTESASVYTYDFADPAVSDHIVGGQRILSAAASLRALLELRVGADYSQKPVVVRNIRWERPIVAKDGAVSLWMRSMDSESIPGSDSLALYTQEHGTQLSVSVDFVEEELEEPESIDVLSLLTLVTTRVEGSDLYQQMMELGLEYGATYKRIQWIQKSESIVLAALDVVHTHSSNRDSIAIGALDSAFQAVAGFVYGNQHGFIGLPHSIDRFVLFRNLTEARYIIARRDQRSSSFDIDITGKSGQLCAQIRGYQLWENTTPAIDTASKSYFNGLYKPIFAEAPLGQNRLPDYILFIDSKSSSIEQIASLIDAYSKDKLHIYDEALHQTVGHWIESIDVEIGSNVCVLDFRLLDEDPDLLNSTAEFDWTYYPLEIYQSVLLKNPSVFGAVYVARHMAQPIAAAGVSISYENSSWWLKTLDISIADKDVLSAFVTNELSYPENAQLRMNGRRREIRQYAIVDSASKRNVIKPGGVYLITGGTGAIGMVLAEYLVKQFGSKVVLVGRGEITESTSAKLKSIGDERVIRSYRADVGVYSEIEEVVRELITSFSRLDGVFHLAGVINDKFALQINKKDFNDVAVPKILGVKNLDKVTADFSLDFFVLFSSLASIFGNIGQVAYAGANGYLDSFASSREEEVKLGSRSGRTLSINWPFWDLKSMAEPSTPGMFERLGGRRLDTDSALGLLVDAISISGPQVLVVSGDLVLPEILKAPEVFKFPNKMESSSKKNKLSVTTKETLESELQSTLSGILKIPKTKLRKDQALHELGLDSSLMVELVGTLETAFSGIPKTLFFEVQTISELSSYLFDNYAESIDQFMLPVVDNQLASEDSMRTSVLNSTVYKDDSAQTNNEKILQSSVQFKNNQSLNDEPIAIVGMSGRFPDADNLSEYWANLLAGKNSVTEIPNDRWDYTKYFNHDRTKRGSVYTKWGGFLKNMDHFDPGFFQLSSRDGKIIDPQERLFLQEVWHALEHSGYSPERIKDELNRQVGVFTGVMWNEYQLHGRVDVEPDERVSLGSSFASIANRTSYFLGLTGPSIAVDTMCSSSLTAMHMACVSLRSAECRMAIAGGVNLSLHPNKYLQLAQSQFASSEGLCRSFGAGGDGYVPGEGVGVLILKSLSEAREHGDNIYGLIRGTAMNHGGAGSGYTVPRPDSQARVIKEAWERAKVPLSSVSYIEAHGTGTSLGDPVEIHGLNLAFSKLKEKEISCPIGSVKSNIGHLEAAAGVAAVVKVIMQFKYETLVPSLHSDPANPNIEFSKSPFYVQKSTSHWPRPTDDAQGQLPRRAGVSSFGAGGVNVHVVLEEAPSEVQPISEDNGPELVVLSAKSMRSLIGRIEDLIQWLAEELEKPAIARSSLNDIAYTLGKGRAHFEYRWALVVSAVDELKGSLESLLIGRIPALAFASDAVVLDGVTQSNKGADFYDTKNLLENNLIEHAKRYANSEPLDWDQVFETQGGKTVVLPPYYFDTKSLWVDPPKSYTVSKQKDRKTVQKIRLKDLGNKTAALADTARNANQDEQTSPRVDSDIANTQEIVHKNSSGSMSSDSKDNSARKNQSVKTEKQYANMLKRLLATQLHEEPNDLAIDRPFADMGVDSVHAVQFVRTINEELNLKLEATLLYDYSSLLSLARYIHDLAPMMDHDSADRSTEVTELQGKPQRDTEVGRKKVVNTHNSKHEKETPSANRADFVADGEPRQRSSESGGIKTSSQKIEDLAYRQKDESFSNSFEDIEISQGADDGSRLDQPDTTGITDQICSTALVKGVDFENVVQFSAHSVSMPEEDFVQISVRVCSISLSDILRFRGLYPAMPKYPFAAGVEVSGIVLRVGKNVSEFSVGDEVIALMNEKFGGHSSIVNAHRLGVVRKPHSIDFHQACTLPSSFLTVYYGLYQQGRLDSGETVLIHTAASALGLMAIQLVKRAGGSVIATCGTREKCEYLTSQGIEHVINYEEEDFESRVMNITHGRGVDIVLNNLKGEMIQKGINCLAEGGRYIESALGAMKTAPKLDLGNIIDNKSIMALGLRSYLWSKPNKLREYLQLMIDLLENSELSPIEYTTFGQDDLQAAIRYIRERKSIGKVLIDIKKPVSIEAPVSSRENLKDVAVVGISGRFPGADNIEQLWDNLMSGTCSVGSITEPRKRLHHHSQEWGGFLENPEFFDPLFFNISPLEAGLMDPQQRVLLEETWKALEDAGIPPINLAGTKTSVFVGSRAAVYGDKRFRKDTEFITYAQLGTLTPIMAGRLSFFFDLKGPAMVVDTACSSSLTALDLAVKSLNQGESETSIVAGVSIGNSPDVDLGSTRYCRSFDQAADGPVMGEGACVVVLKPLEKALADNDRIYGVIKSVVANQDGLSNGIMAPNGTSQTELLKDAWKQAKIEPSQIGLIEAHGTGTKLGDPLEFSALTRAMREFTDERSFCSLGTIKSNLGHLLTAAGIVGLAKVLLCLKNQKIVPSLHFKTANEHIDLEASPFTIPNQCYDWKQRNSQPRLAGVSAFGFSGTNVHAVIEEPPKVVGRSSEASRPFIFPISAKTKQALDKRQHDIAHWLTDLSCEPADVAYTLSVRRQHMKHRRFFVASNVLELKNNMLENEHDSKANDENLLTDYEIDSVYRTLMHEQTALLNNSDSIFRKIGNHYCSGGDVEWNKLFHNIDARCISMPSYPFKTTRCWHPSYDAISSDNTGSTESKSNPTLLIGKLFQDVKGNYFDIDLNVNQFFVRDHKIGEFYVLPGVVALELALQGGKKIWPDVTQYGVDKVVWIRPVKFSSKVYTIRLRFDVRRESHADFSILSLEDAGNEILQSQGKLRFSVYEKPASVESIEVIRKRCRRNFTRDDCYRLIMNSGVSHGPSLRSIQSIESAETECLAHLQIPDGVDLGSGDFILHPSLLDGALQSLVGFAFGRESDEKYLPFSIDSVSVYKPTARQCTAWLRGRRGEGHDILYDIILFADDGSALLEINGLLHKKVPGSMQNRLENQNHKEFDTIVYKPTWVDCEKSSIQYSINGERSSVLFISHQNDPLADYYFSKLKQDVGKIVRVFSGPEFQQITSNEFIVNPLAVNQFNDVLSKLEDSDCLPDHVLYMWGAGSRDERLYSPVVNLVRSLEKTNTKVSVLLSYLCETRDIETPGHYAMMALARTVTQEVKGLSMRVVAAELIQEKEVSDLVLGACLNADLQPEITVCNNASVDREVKISIRELCPVPITKATAIDQLGDRPTIVISGGAGGLGLLFAKHYARNLGAQIALLGRSKCDDRITAEINEIESLGGKALYLSCDITNYAESLANLQHVRDGFGPIAMVIHAAGIQGDKLLRKSTESEFDHVVDIKYQGARILDELTKDDPLVYFCTFSSMGALFGNVGQAAYVYGNAAMDALVRLRELKRKQGFRRGRSVSINWPLWTDGGMRVDEETAHYMENTVGLKTIDTQSGIACFEEILQLSESQYGVVVAKSDLLTRIFSSDKSTSSQAIVTRPAVDETTRVGRPIDADVSQEISVIISELLNIDAIELDSVTDVSELGIDSIMMTALCNRFNERFNLALAPPDLFNISSLDSLIEYVTDQLSESTAVTSALIDNLDDQHNSNVSSHPLLTQSKSSETIRSEVCRIVASTANLSIDDLDPEVDLSEFGFDSIMLTAFMNKLNDQFAVSLTPGEIFAHTTLNSLVDYIEENYPDSFRAREAVELPDKQLHDLENVRRQSFNGTVISSTSPKEVKTRNGESLDDIVVVGMDGKYPDAPNLEQFWDNLVSGRDSVVEVPDNRWNSDEYESQFADGQYCKWGGFLDSVKQFDPLFFSISPRDAELIDPQERLFLQSAWSSIENAGYGPTRIKEVLHGEVGVFAGVMWGDYQLYTDISSKRFLSSTYGSIANRVSYSMDIHGPSMAIDTMCSSSLYAIHLACQSIKNGECKAAIAGGVNLSIHPNKYARLARSHFTASDGRCRAFGEGGDGYVPGEGVGTVFLKKQSEALKDGDYIHGVIRSSTLNHGGKTSNYTVPNVVSQADVIAKAIEKAGISSDSISYLEAHGTGTSLGDPIEIEGLARAFALTRDRETAECSIGSVKSNIGHLEAAAGIAGLHKVLLQMQNRKLVPSLHSQNLNRDISIENTPFTVQQTFQDWNDADQNIAGVSSFGAGGSNAHLIVQSYINSSLRDEEHTDSQPQLIVLSAKSEVSLGGYARKLRDYLERQADAIDLKNISRTLCFGREQYKCRAAFVCHSWDSLLKNLAGLAEGKKCEDIYVGQSSARNSEVQHKDIVLHANGDSLDDSAKLWVSGGILKEKSSSKPIGRIIPLPSYAFLNDEYWFDSSIDHKRQDEIVVSVEPPEFELIEDGVRTHLSPQDPTVAHHVIANQMILPGAATFDLARRGYQKYRDRVANAVSDTIWLRPLNVPSVVGVQIRIIFKEFENRVGFTITSDDSKTLFAKGKLMFMGSDELNQAQRYDLAEMQKNSLRQIGSEEFYQALSNDKYVYGPLYQTVKNIWANGSVSLSRLELDERYTSKINQGRLHPALFDGAFQTISSLSFITSDTRTRSYLPFQVGRVTVFGQIPKQIWTRVESHSLEDSKLHQFDISILDDAGKVLAQIDKFMIREIPTPTNKLQIPKQTAKDLQYNAVLERLYTFFVKKLKLPKHVLNEDMQLDECGLDSITLVDLANMVQEQYEFEPDIAEFSQAVSLGDLAHKICRYATQKDHELTIHDDKPSQPQQDNSELTAHTPDKEKRDVTSTAATSNTNGFRPKGPWHINSSRKIAVIGMSCRFPQSLNEQEYWNHLVGSQSMITEIPPERWDWRNDFSSEKGMQGKSYSKWGGFAPDLGIYDPHFFNISEHALSGMDPQHLLMLELTQCLLDNAGYSIDEISGADAAVILGAAGKSSRFDDIVNRSNAETNQNIVVSSGIQNMIAARISDFYNLRGPSLTMDTACSSSLVAIHDACRLILTGECDTAIAGGVSMFVDAKSHIGFCNARVLSDDDKCYVFDKRAKGLVLGEGAGLVMLKDLDQAIAEGDRIRGVILGSAVNNDGKTMGITTPNHIMQREVILRALECANVNADSIGYLEAHGTGTLLGDPIEIKAAAEAYRHHTQKQGYCPVGSVKSNMGHLLLASGVASFVKVILMQEYGVIPETLNCETPHPRFNFPKTPFFPVKKAQNWDTKNQARRAGISAFGFGGTNCHLITEEFNARQRDYSPSRNPLPTTCFNKKLCWPALGKQNVKLNTELRPNNDAGSVNDSELQNVLESLYEGELSVANALSQYPPS